MGGSPCSKTEDLVHDMLNGTISALAKQALLAHIRSCELCKAVYDELCAVDESIKIAFDSPSTKMPDELKRRIDKIRDRYS
jgi:predicted anti-sigma-YlaC factor YlaD